MKYFFGGIVGAAIVVTLWGYWEYREWEKNFDFQGV